MRSLSATFFYLALGVLIPTADRCAGQEADQPEQPGEEQVSPIKPGLFHLSSSDLYFEFESSYDRRRVNSAHKRRDGFVQRNRDLRFYESLGLSLSGDVIDPDLLSWHAGLKFGLSQERFKEDIEGFGHTDSDSGILLEYDLSIEAFRSKPVSVNAYARRSRNRIARRFLPSLLEEQTEAGISVLAATDNWTTELGFSWDEVDRTDNIMEEDDEQLRTSRFFLDSRWDISDDHRLRIAFDHERQNSEYQGSDYDFDTRRDEVRLEHELRFGDQSQHRLDTILRYNDEHGDLARDEIEVVPRLTLRHSDELQTVYRYSFNRTDQDAIEINRHKFDVQALYRPNDRWRVSLDGFWLRERLDQDIETYEGGGGLDVAYNQPTFLGEFAANAAFSAQRTRTVGSAQGGVVRREGHALGGSRPIYLNQADIRRGTILAYNENRTRVYIAGLDYLAVPVGRRVMVKRVLSGRIAENELVLFDYEYRVPTGSRVDSYRTDLYFEHAFKFGLTPYYGWELRRQSANGSRGVPVYEDNTDRHRIGLRYDRPRWSLGGEYEHFNDTNDPYEAFHLTGRAALLRTDAHTLDAAMELSRYRFTGEFDHRRVYWFDVDVTDRIRINQYLSASVGTAYRWEDDSIDGTTDAVDVECGLYFARGRLSVDLTVEYDLLSLGDSRDEGFGMWLNIRRDFGDFLASSHRRVACATQDARTTRRVR